MVMSQIIGEGIVSDIVDIKGGGISYALMVLFMTIGGTAGS